MCNVVLILSGGVDSTTLLYDLVDQGYNVYALGFNYGQKHVKELEYAKKTCKKLNVNFKVINLENLGEIMYSSLTSDEEDIPEGHYESESMKSTVVPNRNMVMLAIATSYACTLKAESLFYGAHAGDHCVPGNELVFTNIGKKLMSELQINDLVLSNDFNAKKISFKRVVKKISNGIRNDIFKITTKAGRSFKVTGNHRIFQIKRYDFDRHTGWEKELIETYAKDIKPDDWLLAPASDRMLLENGKHKTELVDLLNYCDLNHSQLQYDNDNIWFKKNNKVCRFVSKESFIRLLSWYITEGSKSTKYRYNANTYRVGIPQSKIKNPLYYDEIINTVREWGFNVCESSDTIFFSGPTTKVFELCGNISRNKQIPNEFLLYDIHTLFDTLIKGDGHISSERSYQYVTNSLKLKEQVSWLSIILGNSVGVNITTNSCYGISIRNSFKKKINKFGECRMVQVKTVEKCNSTEVFDIEVEDNHNFFIGTGSGVLVSNSIYPDCRPEFVEKMKDVIKICDYHPLDLVVPYLHVDKAEIIRKGIILEVDYSMTWTCYSGKQKACGKCGSCMERLEAFEYNNIKDPVEYLM